MGRHLGDSQLNEDATQLPRQELDTSREDPSGYAVIDLSTGETIEEQHDRPRTPVPKPDEEST